MNRRGLLALLGGAAAAPAVGVKAAASAIGLDAAVVAAGTVSDVVAAGAPSSSGWWGSPMQLIFDAKERASYRLDRNEAYPHMKSWGRAFRISALERDEIIMMMYRRKLEGDASFREKVLATLGLAK